MCGTNALCVHALCVVLLWGLHKLYMHTHCYVFKMIKHPLHPLTCHVETDILTLRIQTAPAQTILQASLVNMLVKTLVVVALFAWMNVWGHGVVL